MLTWEIVLGKLRRFLRDTAGTPRMSDEELADAWNNAQDDLTNYVARKKTLAVPAGVSRAELPEDLYRIDNVLIYDGEVGYRMPEWDEQIEDEDTWTGNAWQLGDLYIDFAPALQHDVVVCYRAYFPVVEITDPKRPVYVPQWAVQACVYHVAAQSVEKQTVADPQLRQWASRQDAGNPLSNPFLPVAEFMMKRYRQVVYDHISDAQERSTWRSSYPS